MSGELSQSQAELSVQRPEWESHRFVPKWSDRCQGWDRDRQGERSGKWLPVVSARWDSHAIGPDVCPSDCPWQLLESWLGWGWGPLRLAQTRWVPGLRLCFVIAWCPYTTMLPTFKRSRLCWQEQVRAQASCFPAGMGSSMGDLRSQPAGRTCLVHHAGCWFTAPSLQGTFPRGCGLTGSLPQLTRCIPLSLECSELRVWKPPTLLCGMEVSPPAPKTLSPRTLVSSTEWQTKFLFKATPWFASGISSQQIQLCLALVFLQTYP